MSMTTATAALIFALASQAAPTPSAKDIGLSINNVTQVFHCQQDEDYLFCSTGADYAIIACDASGECGFKHYFSEKLISKIDAAIAINGGEVNAKISGGNGNVTEFDAECKNGNLTIDSGKQIKVDSKNSSINMGMYSSWF